MRIVHVLPKGVIGGAEKLALNIAKQQLLKGNIVSIWLLFDGGPILQEAEKEGINTKALNLKSSFNIHGFLKFSKEIKAFAPDIVHVHLASIAILYLKVMKCKFGIVLHQHDLGLRNAGIIKKILFTICKDVPDQYIGVSQYVVNLIEEDYAIAKNKINLVYNGIDLSCFKTAMPSRSDYLRQELDLDDNIRIVGGVGRMVVQKGFDYFLKCARIIKDSYPDTYFVLVGDGPERNNIERLAKELGLNSCSSFLGMRNDVPDLISGFDIFLMTSRVETFGIVVIEALASGVPVVSFEVGGIPEILESGLGITVCAGDFQSLAKHTIDLLNHGTKKDELISRGLEHVKQFDIRKITEVIDSVYISALNFCR
jgi:glycosyltransferase involved in cell wall biosynthesis